jgi:CIC family chloride channel protein
MNVVTDPAKLLLARMLRLLRWRVWIQERLQPTEWQITLLWAGFVGFLGALSSLVFSGLAEGVHHLLSGSSAGVVESMICLRHLLTPSCEPPVGGPPPGGPPLWPPA